MSFEYTEHVIKKWRLEEFMTTICEFENSFVDRVNNCIVEDESYEVLLINIAGKTLVTSREVITLCANGYPDGAFSLARNVFEQMMIIAFFENKKEGVDFLQIVKNYFKSYDLQSYKILKDIYQWDQYPEEKEKYEQRFNSLMEENDISTYKDYWWSNHKSFANLCNSIIKSNMDIPSNILYDLYAKYKQACVWLHANCFGNAHRLGVERNLSIIDTSPTVNGQEIPLIFLSLALIYITGTLCNNFKINNSKVNISLNNLAEFYMTYSDKDKC